MLAAGGDEARGSTVLRRDEASKRGKLRALSAQELNARRCGNRE